MTHSAQTQLNLVIGYPLGHTTTPALHQYLYEQIELDAVMLVASHESINDLLHAIRTLSVQLTAVTIPFKEQIIPLLDEVSENAQSIGAVNTIIHRDGKLCGYNTDVVGVTHALHGVEIAGKNVLLIGAGGAACAVASVVQKAGGALHYVNRTQEKAQELADRFGGTVVAEDAILTLPLNIIINTTPLGMHPNTDRTPIPAYTFNNTQTVFDVVYNPLETKFLKRARDAGARTIPGIDMLVAQAIEQVRLLTGKTVPHKNASTFLRKYMNTL